MRTPSSCSSSSTAVVKINSTCWGGAPGPPEAGQVQAPFLSRRSRAQRERQQIILLRNAAAVPQACDTELAKHAVGRGLLAWRVWMLGLLSSLRVKCYAVSATKPKRMRLGTELCSICSVHAVNGVLVMWVARHVPALGLCPHSPHGIRGV